MTLREEFENGPMTTLEKNIFNADQKSMTNTS